MNYSCLALLAATIALTVPSTGADTMIDDAAAGWIWSGMQSVDDSLLHGGGAHVGGPGSYGAYTFNGTGVDVYAKAGQGVVDADGRAHKMGSLKISIDGSVKADPRLFRTDSDDVIDAFAINNLPPGNHVLQIEPDSGWAEIDYIEVHGATAPDAASTGASSSGSSDDGGKKPGASQSGSGKSASIPNGKVISLLAGANHMYVSVDPNPELPIMAKGTAVASAQLFEVEDEGGGYVALRSVANEMYVCVSPTDYLLYATRPNLDKSVAGGELFRWISNSDGSVSLASYSTRMYVTTDIADSMLQKKGALAADRRTLKDWEKFRVTVTSP